MKILYFTDKYTYDNMGTKRSIFEEVQKQGNEAIWIDKLQIKNILSLIKKHKPDQVWLAHSNLCLSKEVKRQISIPVIGFGFSDPYGFSPKRFAGYNVYVTNYRKTFERYQNEIPMIYNPTACDFSFHDRDMQVEKSIDVSIIGVAEHPWFKNKFERIEVVDKIREFFGRRYPIHAYGQRWPKHIHNHKSVKGEEFRQIIQYSNIGLDIQEDFSPMSHRMFEYAACGVPVITRRRPEVLRFFDEDIEILMYSTHKELLEKLDYYLHNFDKLDRMGLRAWIKCLDHHNISYRVNHLFSALGKII